MATIQSNTFRITLPSHRGSNHIMIAHVRRGTFAGSRTGEIQTHPGGLATPHGVLSRAFVDRGLFLDTRDGFIPRRTAIVSSGHLLRGGLIRPEPHATGRTYKTEGE